MPEFIATFELVDAYGYQTTKSFTTVSTMADFPTGLAAAAALASDIADISGLDVLAYSLRQRVIYTDTADAGSKVDVGATFVLRKADNYKGIVKVPGPVDSIFNADGTVDMTDGLVTAFVGNFITGSDWTFSDGEQASVAISGRLDK